jgi:DNA-binding MarR family transcriptional regulator
MSTDPLDGLYRRPGFMLRRAHQIAVSVFLEETEEVGVTTTQYGVLYILERRPSIDQISVARLLGLDRSTTGMVVKTLVDAGLVHRIVKATDRRRRLLDLSPAGRDLLRKLRKPAERAVGRLLSPLDADERAAFLTLLEKLTDAFNATARVPLLASPEARRSQAGEADARRRP